MIGENLRISFGALTANKLRTALSVVGIMIGVLSNDNPADSDLLNFQSDYDMEFPIVRQSSDIRVSFN